MIAESGQDAFETAARRLERLEGLKAQGQLDENDYRELRSLCVAQMKAAIGAHDAAARAGYTFSEGRQQREPRYGELHAQLVREVSAGYRGGSENAKQRMVRSLAVMAEHQAIYPGDTVRLEAVIEVAMDEPKTSGAANKDTFDLLDELLRRVNELSKLNTEAMGAEDASPTARAIAQTAHQSASEAAEIMRTRRATQPQTPPAAHWALWRSLVLPDIEGAIEGGAAAVTIAGDLAPMAAPAAAVLGVVVGAGIRSGAAHGAAEK
jgi:hypothetical protein